jgi:hypothetical protein
MKAGLIVDVVKGVTKKWAKQRKAEEKSARARRTRLAALTSKRKLGIKAAAWRVMETAYMKASAGGTLPANARQIMYAARPAIQELSERSLNDNYFTQTLLPDYIEEKGVEWDVVFDARGRLTEPHTDKEVPLGTLQVRNYLDVIGRHEVGDLSFNIWEALFPTHGPSNRYCAILFVEKEGFAPLFRKVQLAERYDIAIMSTKGMSVTASRELVQTISTLHGLPVLVLHDFDVSGFTIFGTLSKSTRRFKYAKPPNVIDLGLRMADIDGLETEAATVKSRGKSRATLRRHGATEDEIEFLIPLLSTRPCQRVELNAFASDELVRWIERKLDEHGVTKLVPDDDTITNAYRRMRRQAAVQAKINEVVVSLDDGADDLIVPSDLQSRIRKALESDRTTSWDEALRRIVLDDPRDL